MKYEKLNILRYSQIRRQKAQKEKKNSRGLGAEEEEEENKLSTKHFHF